jgi:hypothetical protein
MTEIRRADPHARRRALLIIAGGAIVGAGLIWAWDQFRPDLHAWLVAEPGARSRRLGVLLLAVAAVVVVPLVGFAVYLWRLGSRILRERQFPPSGWTVVRDTAILRGPAAARRGRVVRGAAALLLVAATVLALLLWRLWLLAHRVAA